MVLDPESEFLIQQPLRVWDPGKGVPWWGGR